MSRAAAVPDSGTVIMVPMGEGRAAEAPHVLVSEGLGSCVAVILYDAARRIGGMAHVMIPSLGASVGNSHGIGEGPEGGFSFRRADTAVRTLVDQMRRMGCAPPNIAAKIAGGARMFPVYAGFTAGIGDENVRSAKEALVLSGIRLAGWDVGGTRGRSVIFYLDTGRVVVKPFGMKERDI